jgi:hypothetical protein
MDDESDDGRELAGGIPAFMSKIKTFISDHEEFSESEKYSDNDDDENFYGDEEEEYGDDEHLYQQYAQ